MKTHAISIQKLDTACLPKFLQFFDGDAFSDNPKWSSCYCQCFYEDHNVVKWSDRTAEQNRALACSRTASGDMQGWLASENDRPVGWCGAVAEIAKPRMRAYSTKRGL